MKAVLSAVIVLVFATTAQAIPITYQTVLSGANETPPIGSGGTGFATITYDATTHLLGLDITFSGLTGLTTASHIHCCGSQASTLLVATTTPTFAGFPLGVTSGTYVNSLDLSLASSFNPAFVTAQGGTLLGAELALAAGLANGGSYLNIHSSVATGGEIRGTIRAAVPEPTTLALLGLGLAGMAARRRRSGE